MRHCGWEYRVKITCFYLVILIHAVFNFVYSQWVCDVNYLSVRLIRHRSCCSDFNWSFDCCWLFCVRTSLQLFPELVEIHRPWLMHWLARTNCLAYDGSADVTLVSLENIFSASWNRMSMRISLGKVCL